MGNFLRLVNGVPRSFAESSATTVYDENIVVGPGGITTGTPITLPSSHTYDSDELEVYLDNLRQTPVLDYFYEGSVPRTQISFTFDLLEGETIRFRIDRAP